MKKPSKKVLSAISFQDKDHKLEERLSVSDKITSKEIFDLEFGDNLPKSIKSNSDRLSQNKMHIIPIHKDPYASKFGKFFNSLGAFGYVYGKSSTFIGMRKENDNDTIESEGLTRDGDDENNPAKDKQIFLNNKLFSKPGQLAILGLGSAFYSVVSNIFSLPVTITKVMMGILYLDPISSTFHNAVVAPITTLLKSKTDVLGHEHIHNLQKENHPLYDPYKNEIQIDLRKTMRNQILVSETFNKSVSLRKIRSIDNFFSEGMIQYLGSDLELQARLHTIIANGSHRWKHIPENPLQLWQGLLEAGLKAPQDIKDMVKVYFDKFPEESIVKDQDFKDKFEKAGRYLFTSNIVEVNAVYNSHYIQENKMHFWTESIPYLYGHLLEMYGDEEGLTKMQFNDEKAPSFYPKNRNKAPYI